MNDVGTCHSTWQSEAHELWALNPMCCYRNVLPLWSWKLYLFLGCLSDMFY